jgi:PAS domain S-box-containing protein
MLASKEIKVAIIDDDQDDFIILSDYINQIEGSKFSLTWCNNYDAALEAITARAFDLYFVDYRLGAHTGLDLLQAAGAMGVEEPIVILTGMGNKDIDIKSMQYGATDYLVKSDLNTEKLERCIRYSLDRSNDLKQLKSSETKYRNLFESSKDSVFILDESFHLKEVNDAFAGLLAVPKQSLIGQELVHYIRDQQTRDLVITNCQNKESCHDIEVEIEDRNGERKYCLLSISFLPDNAGGETFHGILHDITSMRKNQAINLRAHKLATNERLMRTLAHEIRNPLNNLSLAIEQISLGEDRSEDVLLSIMQRNCKRINQIITELLDSTKLPELSFASENLQDLLDDSIRDIEDRIKLQQVTLVKDYPSNNVKIAAHKSKLTIAFTNILINAIEAMQTGTGQLNVNVNETDDHAVVRISDNGCGIPEEYVSNLFEPYFSLKKNGVGLGLAASHSILQSHGARIEIESKQNVGTVFNIMFNKEEAVPEA